MTFCAYASMTATSSGLALRTLPPPAAGTADGPAGTWPNAPNRTFASERFIARPISTVSMVPEAPTSIPPTIRALFLKLEAGRRGREPGAHVKEGDHDRHVGAADRQHEQESEQ